MAGLVAQAVEAERPERRRVLRPQTAQREAGAHPAGWKASETPFMQ